ncbi:hypothetical protein LWI28_004275 [Acer negundo]|uniref:Uncharacterized protein n=1 Tax=Acer negundo TaxID=4023 RepID=A0AAD5IXH4_ACENE|nr:hypothetical protein LWI28_004275 [Acer negundo]
MPKEEANYDDERGVVTEIPITTKISDRGNEEVQLELVIEEPRSIAQESPIRVSKPLQRYGCDDENDKVHFALMAPHHLRCVKTRDFHFKVDVLKTRRYPMISEG